MGVSHAYAVEWKALKGGDVLIGRFFRWWQGIRPDLFRR
jgi:hypothetical protein